MRIVVHDYAGHAFTAQLARALAERGHGVTYVSCSGFESPKGRVITGDDDPDGFRAVEIGIGRPVDKDNLVRRWLHQHAYANRVRAFIASEKPEAVLSSAPVEVQAAIAAACRKAEARFAFWVQDIHAEAIARLFSKRWPAAARLAGSYYRRKEAKVLRASDAVVVISEAFRDVFANGKWKLDTRHMTVIENWANIADIPPLARDNDWAKAHMGRRPRIVYSGTLARKHNPELVVELARSVEADVYLFSQGSGAEHVHARAEAEKLDNLFVRPWVPVEDLPKMLAGADIVFAVIEADAGVFSVPSKVLSYFAAGRPILAAIPQDNLAGRNIRWAGAGLVSDPEDTAALIDNARTLLAAPDRRAEMGANGRAWAEKMFDIDAISGRFEVLLQGARR